MSEKWSDLFPDGRHIFYEGDNPDAFVGAMRDRFGFDPSKNNPNWNERRQYGFHCPARLLDEIYGKFPMGS